MRGGIRGIAVRELERTEVEGEDVTNEIEENDESRRCVMRGRERIRKEREGKRKEEEGFNYSQNEAKQKRTRNESRTLRDGNEEVVEKE